MKAKTKPNNEDQHAVITEHISRVVLAMNGKDVDVDYVANVVESRIDVHQISPHLTKYLATLELKQQVRSYLRHRYDPEVVVADKIQQGKTEQEDLFDDILQDRYPAVREHMGVKKTKYVIKENLTEDEVEIVAVKMEKAGRALIEHAKALRAWFQSK